jgi:hypothetical protein
MDRALPELEKIDRIEAQLFGVAIAADTTAIAIHRRVRDNVRSFKLVIVEKTGHRIFLQVCRDRTLF